MRTFKMYSRNTKTTNEPTASNNKSGRPQVNIWDTWNTLTYLNKNDSFHLKAVTWVRMRKKKPVISSTGKFVCFNNNVSNLYNNRVVEKIYGMAYVFTLLMIRKPNKTTVDKNRTTSCYRSTSFGCSFIFRHFKVFQLKRIVYI